VGLVDGVNAAVRYARRTAGSIGADLASAVARVGEVTFNAVNGVDSTPGTIRLTVLILSDENGVPVCRPEDLQTSIDRADAVLSAEANLRVRHVGTHTVTEPAPTEALDPRANKLLLLDETIGRTEFYHRQMRAFPDTGYDESMIGRPVTAIVVREIAGRTTGCSLGISADWVVVQASLFKPDHTLTYDETVLAHEIGHALNLPHHPARENLMYYSSSPPEHLRGTELAGWQRAVLTANRHVVPGLPS
jgi:hypothetical protein